MTEIVDPDQIEQIVGARRHPVAHLGRAVSDVETVFILHSRVCRAQRDDLRTCPYSLALDLNQGVDGLPEWDDHLDQTVTLRTEHGYLLPDDDGPDDVVLIEAVSPR